MQCIAKSKRSGKRCRNNAVTGYRVCRMHGANGGRKSTKGNTGFFLKALTKEEQIKAKQLIHDFELENYGINTAERMDIIAGVTSFVKAMRTHNPDDPNAVNAEIRFKRDFRDTIDNLRATRKSQQAPDQKEDKDWSITWIEPKGLKV